MATYELDLPRDPPFLRRSAQGDGIAEAMLYQNARWFTKVRWGVIAVIALVGVVSRLAPEAIRSLGFVPPLRWPWILGASLVAANAAFCLHVLRLGPRSSRGVIRANIWLQIVMDLLILTALVHVVGSTDSLIACFYLLHITLACVFFGRRESLLVILLAAALYGGCVGLELSGVLPVRSVFVDSPAHQRAPVLTMLLASVLVFVWVAVWYLVGTLAQAVRDRDRKLDAANRELTAADERMNLKVLRTTHDLKAPFSGMVTNIRVLRMKHWESVPQDVRDIIERIERRGEALSRRIGDILLLGELRSQKPDAVRAEATDLRSVIGAAVEEIRESADSRGISIDVQIPAASVAGDRRQFAILFGNLLCNAVSYSRDGGRVEVSADRENGLVRVSVADQGIGIPEDALPHVFEEYFRTKEAMKANAMSTGLGLAIVKKIAHDLRLRMRVTSEPGKGTKFEVIMQAHTDTGGSGE